MLATNRSFWIAALTVWFAACSRPPAPRVLTDERREAVVAATTALDDRWGKAALASDVDAALACFRAGPGFSFGYDGGMLTEFADFTELVRRSYEGRQMELESVGRRVAALAPDVAVLTGISRATITGADGKTTKSDYVYGFVCTEVDGTWKIVQAHEFSVR